MQHYIKKRHNLLSVSEPSSPYAPALSWKYKFLQTFSEIENTSGCPSEGCESHPGTAGQCGKMLIVRQTKSVCEGTRRNRRLKPRWQGGHLMPVSALMTAGSVVIGNPTARWWSRQVETIVSLKPWEGPLTSLVAREAASPGHLSAKALYIVFIKKRGF